MRYIFAVVTKRLFLSLLVTTLFVSPFLLAQDASKPFKLQEVHFKGSKRYSEAQLIQVSGLKLGDTVSGKSLQEVANQMGRTGEFATISFMFNGTTAEFAIIDAKELVPAQFENILWFSDQELAQGIHERLPLFDGVVPTGGEMGMQIGHAIEEMLKQKGVANPEVEVMPVLPGPGKPVSAMSFSVVTPQVQVAQLKFEGAAPVNETELRKATTNLLGSDYKRSATQEGLASVLRNYYHRQGFVKADVTAFDDALLSTTNDMAKVALTAKVNEGSQYYVGDVKWASDGSWNINGAEKLVVLKSGFVANEDLLKVTLDNFSSVFGQRGYLRAKADAKPTFDEAQHRVSYTITMALGPQFHVTKVTFRGLPEEQRQKLQEAFKLKAGDVMNQKYVRDFLFSPEAQQVTKNRFFLEWSQTVRDSDQSVELVLQPAQTAARMAQ